MVLGVPWFHTEKIRKVEKPGNRRSNTGVRRKLINWTPEMDDAIRTEYPVSSTAELAMKLGVSAKNINARASVLGIRKDKAAFSAQMRANIEEYHRRKGSDCVFDPVE